MQSDGSSPQASAVNRKRGRPKSSNVLFFCFFLIIIFCQTFYWLFANRLDPILLGMPFGLFLITALIVLEFIGLILLYRFQEK